GLITTPTKMAMFLETNEELLPKISTYMIGAEKLEGWLVNEIRVKSPNAVIYNGYGPTETTCGVLYYECSEVGGNIPIGRPIANTQIYIMNGTELCGVGIAGELCIAGAGLARGYLNKPELTAEKFVKNPFGEGKLYRTGDLARWLPDGNIEYLGRIDEQVKIRGFRIELGEIDDVLRTLPEIKDCAVIARNDETGSKAIYAYLVSDEEISLSTVRDRLSKVLPEYMIPSYMGQIEAIPVTKNGKLDKKALPELESVGGRDYVAPKTCEEFAVARVFSGVLGVKRVGANDDFFELGGDSIKAIRVVTKLRDENYDISVMDVMQSRTPSAIAPRLKNAEGNRYEQGEVNGEVVLTPVQRDFFASNMAVPSHYNQATMLYKADGFDADILKRALDAIVIHHDILRAVFANGTQAILSSEESRMYDLYEYTLSEGEIEGKCTEIQSGINLENGPLMKVGLFHTEGGDHLLLCMHHLVIDGVSWRIVIEDFVSAYRQSEQGADIILPEKTASFMQWAKNLAEYADSDELYEQAEYWDKIAREMKPMDAGSRFENYSIELDADVTSALLYDAHKAYGTEINDLLLTALGLAYMEWTGNDRVEVELEAHGREQVGRPLATDRTVGWFTSVYPICLKTFDSIGDSIIENKEMLRKIPNHGIGYGILKYLKCRYDNIRSEVCFNYLGQFDTEANNMEGIEISPLSVGESIAAANAPHNRVTFNGSVKGGKLIFEIIYASNYYTRAQIEQLGSLYCDAIIRINNVCSGQEETVKTASDFGLDISQDALNEIFDLFE
ncbi:MAG: AMP-binding protein, partial [Clostridia bacterium]|nr:AMP-binding protein [Clostridia bacterium]